MLAENDRPGDEGFTPRYVRWALWAIVALALGLRLWGIGFGLPYDFTPDEIHEIMRALKLGAGEYDWDGFGKGGLYLILFVEYGFLYVFWRLTGHVGGANDFALQYLQDPTAFYLLGRVTVALMGAGTCLVIYWIGKRLYGWRTGLVAAFLGTTAYFHAAWSHYVNVDTGMTLAVWASLLAYLKYEETDQSKWLVISGALIGIAVAFKLPGLAVVVPLGLAVVTPLTKWSHPMRPLRVLAIGAVSFAIALVVVAPESIRNVPAVLGYFSQLIQPAGTVTERVSDQGISGSVFGLTQLTFGNFLDIPFTSTNLALTIAALLGAGLAIYRRHRWDLIWLAFGLTYFLAMVAADRPGHERYLLPIMPVFWLLGARAVLAVAGARRFVTPVLVAGICAAPLYMLVQQNVTWTRPDTRILGKHWIEANVPPGSRILMDGMRYRFIQSPPLHPDEATVTRRVQNAEHEGENLSRGVSSRTLALYAEAMSRAVGPRYELHSTVYGLDVRELSYYVESCFDYIVVSGENAWRFERPSEAARYPLSARFYQGLPRDPRFQVVYAVEPAPWRIQGPAITVYKVLHSCE
jgi:4-amino-4-deoxy-L-arabinose transferase-like glycosyltransferase